MSHPRRNKVILATYHTSTRTTLMRPEAPLLMDTADFGHWKCSATSAISSSFALPSIGADLTRASQVPPSASSNDLSRELGLTLTRMTTALLCFKVPHGRRNSCQRDLRRRECLR